MFKFQIFDWFKNLWIKSFIDYIENLILYLQTLFFLVSSITKGSWTYKIITIYRNTLSVAQPLGMPDTPQHTLCDWHVCVYEKRNILDYMYTVTGYRQRDPHDKWHVDATHQPCGKARKSRCTIRQHVRTPTPWRFLSILF